jgi:hypothetical protein
MKTNTYLRTSLLSMAAAALLLMMIEMDRNYGIEERLTIAAHPVPGIGLLQSFTRELSQRHSDTVINTVSATVDDSILTLVIQVQNSTNGDIIVCPSYVNVSRPSPSTVRCSSRGLGRDFDIYLPDQAPRGVGFYEPFPHVIPRRPAQLVVIPRDSVYTFEYEYVHQERSTTVENGPWTIYGEFGLPAWRYSDEAIKPVIDSARFARPSSLYRLKQTHFEFYDDEFTWYTIVSDTTFTYLSREMQYLLRANQIPGKRLTNPFIQVTKAPQK